MSLLAKALIGAGVLVSVKGLDNRLEITHYEPQFANLPAGFDGFRIVHISDIHSDTIPGLTEEISKCEPDIIVITGDILHDNDKSFLPTARLIKQLMSIAPVYMISGNHDLWNTRFSEFVALCEKSGAVFMDNKMTTISRNGDEIGLFGIADPYSKSTGTIIKNLDNSFAALPEYDGFKLLLFHRANQFDRIKDKGFDLILAGHMHGGQFRIPGLGGLMPPKSSLPDSKQLLFPAYCNGVFTHNNTTMIVNRGLGNPMIIPRLYNRPEIGFTVLRRGNE
ncbi:MAG: metallophosphoesterase [Eubacteriales bacterium]|nr:metallophosphoesterase [Eubacteriales bacterium]